MDPFNMSADIQMPEHIRELLATAENMGLASFASQWRNSFEQTLSKKEIFVIFLGEFNHGKSSLINALVGENILPYGVTPTTQIDTYLHFATGRRAVTASAGNEQIAQWRWDDWQKASRNKLPDILIKKSADRIDIDLDLDIFDRECVFIDTPGLNEASFVRESFLNRYIRRADLLLFLLDANQAMTHTEQDLLSKLSLDQPTHARAIVINKCDRLDEEETLEVCHYIETCLDFPVANEPFYMISSKKKSGDWALLRKRIHDEIEAGKQSYEARNSEKLGSQLSNTLEGFYPIYRALEQLDVPALRALKKLDLTPERQMTPLVIADILHRISQHIAHLKQLVTDDTDRFEQAFLKAIPREINKVFLEDVEKYLEDFIRDSCLEFARNTYHIILDSLDNLMHKLWNDFIPDADALPRFEFHLQKICNLLNTPTRTGAFDTAENVAMFFTPVPILLSGRAERPRREMLRKLAEKDISIHAESLRSAFQSELDHQNNILNELIRDNCHQIQSHIQNIAAHLLDKPRTDWNDIESVLSK